MSDIKIIYLIGAYEKAIPIFKQANKEKWDILRLFEENMSGGICFYLAHVQKIDISPVFKRSGYYKNIMNGRVWLFPQNYMSHRYIKKRIDFMESEIMSLRQLQKKGYTHV